MTENVKNWTPGQRKYQEWLATPKFTRTPPTQEMFAKSIKVSPVTVSRWKKLDGFQAAVNAIARQYLNDDLPDIFGALRREAVKGSYQHIKLSLELTGEYQESLDVTSAGQPVKGYAIFSPDDWDDDAESGGETTE